GSMIFWGPPGSGKTTIARIIANRTGMTFLSYSAVVSGIKEIKEVISAAKKRRKFSGERTILFVDEIHRFNKAQQDAFLPYIESGDIILIGATTENPSFEVNAALLSRCRVYILKKLSGAQIKRLIERALADREKGLGNKKITLEDSALEMIVNIADGDARKAYNMLEFCAETGKMDDSGAVGIDRELVEKAAQRSILYDKSGEEHFNLISALHKSMRGSDPDAAVYYLTRMLKGGDDPMYLARRLVRFAAEDVGLADPNALQVAIAGKETYHFLGSPEGELALVEVAVYLATAPKSNSLYSAYKKAQRTVDDTGALPVPLFIRNAPTALMESIGYGKDYRYDHDSEEHYIPQDYLPEEIKDKRLYKPGKFGYEREIKKRLEWWAKMKEKGDEP
ncbi:MAG: AAA family ATPase, partial [candidate division Zixibacteria bacterium]|nr:AAA family ATPase [candidate division Zixibacteria bacterium]